ncbi:MAG: RHS repeat-associated core domain-containing protein, partial [Thermoguttaceae bacterium]
AFNNRIGVSVNNGSGAVQTWTVYDGSNPYADLNSTGQVTDRYLYSPVVDAVLADVSTAGGGTTSWELADELGSVRDVVSAQGAVIDHIQYDSFGNILSQSNPSNGDQFTYAQQQTDATGLNYDRARYYNPATGRFISQDPTGFAAGDVDLYRYVGNSPTTEVDPTGLQESGGSPSLYTPGQAAAPPGQQPQQGPNASPPTTTPPNANSPGQPYRGSAGSQQLRPFPPVQAPPAGQSWFYNPSTNSWYLGPAVVCTPPQVPRLAVPAPTIQMPPYATDILAPPSHIEIPPDWLRRSEERMQKEMQKQIDSGYYDDMFKNAQSSGSPWWKPYEDIGKSVGGGIKGGKPYGDLHLQIPLSPPYNIGPQ